MRVIELSEMPTRTRSHKGEIAKWLRTITAFPEKAIIVHRSEFPTERMRDPKSYLLGSMIANAVTAVFGPEYRPACYRLPNDEFAIAVVKRDPKDKKGSR